MSKEYGTYNRHAAEDEDEYVLGYVYKRRSFKIRMSKEHGLITYVQLQDEDEYSTGY
jgi:hypothetical protein